MVKKTFICRLLPEKKQLEKWPFFDQNHGLTPLEKRQPRRQGAFPAPKAREKRPGDEVGKIAIFRLFKLLVFIAYKGVFSFYKILKDIFLAYNAQKKKLQKMAIFGPKP